jgi:hypothetical protein
VSPHVQRLGDRWETVPIRNCRVTSSKVLELAHSCGVSCVPILP